MLLAEFKAWAKNKDVATIWGRCPDHRWLFWWIGEQNLDCHQKKEFGTFLLEMYRATYGSVPESLSKWHNSEAKGMVRFSAKMPEVYLFNAIYHLWQPNVGDQWVYRAITAYNFANKVGWVKKHGSNIREVMECPITF